VKTTLIDITGKRYGRWTVLSQAPRDPRKGGDAEWRCRCDCGTESVVRSSCLRTQESRSCGCLHRELNTLNNTKPPGHAARRGLFSTYRAKSKHRGLGWEIEPELFYQLTSQNCTYCGSKPSQVSKGRTHNGHYLYNGLDRVDSSKGYFPDNVVPCCGICNFAKGRMSHGHFMDWIIRIVQFYYPPPSSMDIYELESDYKKMWPSLAERTQREVSRG
jgi:hypothetical protein